MFKHTPTAMRCMAALALLGLVAACSRQVDSTDSTQPGAVAATDPAITAAVAAGPEPAVGANVQAMRAEDLRAAANKALTENRIYAPGGDNAMEYYLALRDKQPEDATTTSALTDLMPYTVIAAEQSISRKDFAEAKRLLGLIAKSDPKAPALPRLDKAIGTGEKQLAEQQSSDQASKSKQAADAKNQAKEAQRVAEQAAQQQLAAAALAAQQAQAQRAEAARADAARQAAAATSTRPAATERPAAAAVAEVPPPRPAAVSSAERHVLSAPPPHYPMEALRANTSGLVIVEITIGGDGDVTNVRIVEATPPHVFERAALAAVKRWKFEPTGTVSTARRTIAFNPG